MLKNPLLLIALALTIGVSIWGIIDTQGLSQVAAKQVSFVLRSRGWFVMLQSRRTKREATLKLSIALLSMMRTATIWRIPRSVSEGTRCQKASV